MKAFFGIFTKLAAALWIGCKLVWSLLKAVVIALGAILKLLYRIGLLFPLCYLLVGLILRLTGNLVPNTMGYTLFWCGFLLLTIGCVVSAARRKKRNAQQKLQKTQQELDRQTQKLQAKGWLPPAAEEEEPKIFRSVTDPALVLYEYPDRVEYYRDTRQGLQKEKTVPKPSSAKRK